jgi:hypothetical protein
VEPDAGIGSGHHRDAPAQIGQLIDLPTHN